MNKHANDEGHGVCPVCFLGLLDSPQGTTGDYSNVVCPKCGSFRISRTAARMFATSETLGAEGSRKRANLSSWLRERCPGDMIGSDFLRRENSSSLGVEYWTTEVPGFHEKAIKLLKALAAKTEYAGQRIEWRINKHEFEALAWALNEYELLEYFAYLKSMSWISGGVMPSGQLGSKSRFLGKQATILPGGWAKLEEIKKINPSSEQAFMAMWFDEETKLAWAKGFSLGIKKAHYRPSKIDEKEHSNKIDDEIIAEIRQSKFLVADLTDHRGGVYFEAGFAKGLGLPVIWTCREDYFEKRHFDIRQYNCISWNNDNLDGLAEAVKNRILAVVGKGPVPYDED